MRTETKHTAVAWRHPLVIAHAGVVVGLIGLLAVLGWVGDVDAAENIGAGAVGLLLGVLGAPWSLSYFALDSISGTESATPAGVFVSLAALVNVVLHVLIRWWNSRHASEGK
jgi:hypothetical protein